MRIYINQHFNFRSEHHTILCLLYLFKMNGVFGVHCKSIYLKLCLGFQWLWNRRQFCQWASVLTRRSRDDWIHSIIWYASWYVNYGWIIYCIFLKIWLVQRSLRSGSRFYSISLYILRMNTFVPNKSRIYKDIICILVNYMINI